MLINHFPLSGSGSGVHTINIAKSLVKLGHQVSIIMPENEIVKSSIPGIILHPVLFNTKELPFNFPCFTTHPRSTTTFYELDDRQYSDYKRCFREEIGKVIKEFKPDIIHSGHIWTLSSIASEFGVPVVITAHGTDLLGIKKGDKRYINDALDAYEKASAIIAISQDNANLTMEIFGESDKVRLIPNGYDSSIFKKKNCDKKEVLKKYGIDKNYEKIVCFAGKFTEIKGIDTLLKACEIYEDEDTLTLLAGGGALLEDMKQYARDLGLKNVIFLGNLPPVQLQEIFEIADVSTVPSRSEAFGLVAIEAIACGTPVVASKVGGLPTIVNNDVGSLIDVDDYQKLAEKVKYWLAIKDKVDSDALSRYALENYSQDKFTNELYELYASCAYRNQKKEII